mgnify:FL=1
MSVVTNVILMVPVGADSRDVDHVNAQLAVVLRVSGCGLLKVDQYAGGNKAVQADIYMGAFNYLSRQVVLEILAAAPWDASDRAVVRVAIQEEWDDAFTFHDLGTPP